MHTVGIIFGMVIGRLLLPVLFISAIVVAVKFLRGDYNAGDSR